MLIEIQTHDWLQVNVSYPSNGTQKCVTIDDELKLRPFFDKRMAQEVPADSLGDEWKGYVFRITGGNDKQGFPMVQGIFQNKRVRLLLTKGLLIPSCLRCFTCSHVDISLDSRGSIHTTPPMVDRRRGTGHSLGYRFVMSA